MPEDSPDIDVPEEWVTRTCRFSGNFRLIAKFKHRPTGTEVRVTPYKTYSDQPGFCNAHRVILVQPDGGVEEVAVGMSIEHVEEAKQAAQDAMSRIERR